MPIRFLVVDDSKSFLDAARLLLEREGLTIAGVASSCAEALREAEALRPDVILVDISLGEDSGFDLARRLVEDSRAGGPTVILISTHSEADFADLIAESPALGFLPKSELSASAVSEMLTNAAKHSQASVVHVDVGTRDGTLYLSVRDDGSGEQIRQAARDS